jgi:hypothetical protein
MIQWQFFPKNKQAPELLQEVVGCFTAVESEIDSDHNKHKSNVVLSIVSPHLQNHGFRVETGKKRAEKIRVPVLFGLNGKPKVSFEADAYHLVKKTIIEVEAGRAYMNYQFLKDLFEACMMLDIEYLVIAVRRTYLKVKDFDKIVNFFDTLYTSDRIELPLKGVLILGY